MTKYKGVVREIYEYEIEIEAKDGSAAMEYLKEVYNDDEKNEGIFVADANSFLRTEFSLRKLN